MIDCNGFTVVGLEHHFIYSRFGSDVAEARECQTVKEH
jgi:hypothetical protein